MVMNSTANIKHNWSSYFYMNYLSLFGDTVSSTKIKEITAQAVEHKCGVSSRFDNRVEKLKSELVNNNQNRLFSKPKLRGLSVEQIKNYQSCYGRVIFAPFHFDEHRHILLDLIAHGLSSCAPVAGKCFWDLYQLRNLLPTKSQNLIRLLEVEDVAVGKELVKEMRKGSNGFIYCDGNMGSGGNRSKEGTSIVNFFNKRIRVKSGIARIAMLFKSPIIPVFSTQDVYGNRVLTFEAAIFQDADIANRELVQQNIIQELYSRLERKVSESPDKWEYALCLHRWLEPENNSLNVKLENNIVAENHVIEINKQRVAFISQNTDTLLVDTQQNKAYKAPAIMSSFFALLRQQTSLKIKELLNECPTEKRNNFMSIVQEMVQQDLLFIKSA